MTIIEIIDNLIDSVIRGCLLGCCLVILYYGIKEWIKDTKALIKKLKQKHSNRKHK